MRVKTTFAVLALAALALALPASSAARTVHVEPGESIQAAIDEAKPGTTIKLGEGTYSGDILIDKDEIELVGAGRKKTKLVPPQSPGKCDGNGICVMDVDDQFNPQSTVEDVEISHLSVDGFHGFGMFFLHTEDGEVTHTIVSDYGEYGIFANDSRGTKIARNVFKNEVADVDPAPGTQLPEAGIYIGDSLDADATVWRNVSYGNLLGIFIRDAVDGQVVKNKAFSNCVGFLILNTPAPVDTHDWLIEHNNSTANNKTCDPVEGGEAPPLSGVGIASISSSDIRLIDNGVFGNKAPDGFQSAFAGGIVVVSDPAPAPPSRDVKVGFNTAIGNDPDLFWDEQGTGNAFFRNDCLTSQPDGLCEDPDDHGHEGDDDHGDNGHRGDDDNHRSDDGDHKGDRDHRGDHKKHKKAKKKHKKSKKHKSKKRHHDDD
jgi:Right handed beta helix region